MKLFYEVSQKELVKIRNKIFIEYGIPSLEKNGFKKTPFSNHWYGKDDMGGYDYKLCRLNHNGNILEFISVNIIKGDRWIQIRLNIFELEQRSKSLKGFKDLDGIKFSLNPNRKTEMRLRIDDFKGIPLFRVKEHKLKSFKTKLGLEKRVKQLSELVEKDMSNIDSFVSKWYEMYTPNITDWKGHVIKNNNVKLE